jgi:hypothetical protein
MKMAYTSTGRSLLDFYDVTQRMYMEASPLRDVLPIRIRLSHSLVHRARKPITANWLYLLLLYLTIGIRALKWDIHREGFSNFQDSIRFD